MKKRIGLLALILIPLLLLPVYAYSKELPRQEAVPVNKVWNITFKEEVDQSTLADNVYISDDKGNKVNTVISLSEDKKTVTLTPSADYEMGQAYTIHVLPKVKTTSGNYLDQEYTKVFTIKEEFILKSSAFEAGGTIPVKYALTDIYGGQNKSIPLQWSGAPKGTKSFALLIYDLHPIASNWIHWAVVNIPADTRELKEGASGTTDMPSGCSELYNDFGTSGYGGPCPPSGTGDHEYKIILYALDTESISLPGTTTYGAFEAALGSHILERKELSGYFAQ